MAPDFLLYEQLRKQNQNQNQNQKLKASIPIPAPTRRLSLALGAADVALLVMLYVLVGRMEAQPSLWGWVLITAGVALAAWLGCLAAAQARSERERQD